VFCIFVKKGPRARDRMNEVTLKNTSKLPQVIALMVDTFQKVPKVDKKVEKKHQKGPIVSRILFTTKKSNILHFFRQKTHFD